jgi:FtsH-binding integral membrane protein
MRASPRKTSPSAVPSSTNIGVFLFICIIILLCFSILLIFTQSPLLHIIVCVITIIVYSLYLIYDTQLIMGGKVHNLVNLKRYELDMDDYIIGALLLYVDIIVLFLELLKLLLLLFGEK